MVHAVTDTHWTCSLTTLDVDYIFDTLAITFSASSRTSLLRLCLLVIKQILKVDWKVVVIELRSIYVKVFENDSFHDLFTQHEILFGGKTAPKFNSHSLQLVIDHLCRF